MAACALYAHMVETAQLSCVAARAIPGVHRRVGTRTKFNQTFCSVALSDLRCPKFSLFIRIPNAANCRSTEYARLYRFVPLFCQSRRDGLVPARNLAANSLAGA